MGSFYIPPAIINPAVIEDLNAPVIYSDGGIVRIGAETCTTICYRIYTFEGRVELHEVARIIQPRSAFDSSLTRAWLLATGPMDGRRENGH